MTARSEGGQAAVELVAVLPLVATALLAAGQLLAAGVAHELAGNAAEAGALALVRGQDPAAAARRAVPGWSRGRLAIRIAGRRVTVRLRPLTVFPGAGEALAPEVAADAGPAPAVRQQAGRSWHPDAGRSRDDPTR